MLHAGFEVLAAVALKSTVLWAVTRPIPETTQRFGGTCNVQVNYSSRIRRWRGTVVSSGVIS
jgi:hypothetical protein